MFLSFFCCFFFSSRRRHTRYIGDWSSDVCSSDLGSIALDLCGEPLLLEDGDQPGAQRFAELEEVPVRPRTAKLGQGGDGRSRRDGVASDARREPDVAVLTEPILADEIEHVGAAGDHADRIPAAERLAEG